MARLRSLCVLFSAFLFAFAAFGQGTTGSITGTVTSDNAPLPGVTVTISSPAMQGTRTTVTGEGGGFTFPSVPPGQYSVTYELSGMAKLTQKVGVQLGSTARADADLKMSAIAEAITVTASAPAVLETTDVVRNFSQEEVAQLPVRRNITDTVFLTPGVNNSGARGNISISGGMSYDNLFLVNGVTVNENLRGQPHNLFIEDAIQETTVITGSVSAEYGRFTGGVVSAITKSGGNEFHGSLRDSMTNAAWIDETEIETTEHPSKISNVYEGTLGGFILRDRLWFFAAGRDAKGAPANGFNATASTTAARAGDPVISFQNTIDEKRYEGKLTAQIVPQHSVIASYLDVDTVESNNFFAPIYDESSIVRQRSLPNKLMSLAYNGVVTTNFLVEGAYSEKEFAFVGSGGVFTDPVRGTWIQDTAGVRFNAPVFCGVCTDEERNNDSLLLKGTYFLNTRALGTHSIAFGGEQFNETRLVNNYQSASQYQITSGSATRLVNGEFITTFNTGSTLTYRPILQLSSGSDLSTRSYFINDKWDFNSHWSFNVGVRYDKNDAIDASGNLVSDDSAFSPRLGVIYDIRGDSRYRINASYSHYVAKIVDGNVGGGAAGAGNPAAFSYRYGGPAINPAGTPDAELLNPQEALTVIFNWFNSLTAEQKAAALTSQTVPGYTQRILEPLTSPYVREIVLGFGSQLTPNAYARIDVIRRDWHDFYATQLDLSTGTIVDPTGRTNDLAVLINDDENIEREYTGVQTQFNWRPGKFNVGGGYTWSRLTGNDVPEGDGTAAVPNQFGHYYPEYLNYQNRQPTGYLNGDQRHRARLWAGYDFTLPLGVVNLSAIQSYDSGRAFSAIGSINARTAPGVTAVPGYTHSQIGTSHNYYFSKRGGFRTDAAYSTDLALNYSLPIFGFEIFLQGQALNIFNSDAVNDIYLGRINTTVHTARSGGRKDPANPLNPNAAPLEAFNPFRDTPVEGVHYLLDPNFGKAANKDGYQQPRTYRVAVGLRF